MINMIVATIMFILAILAIHDCRAAYPNHETLIQFAGLMFITFANLLVAIYIKMSEILESMKKKD